MLRKAHICSTLCLRRFSVFAFDTVSMFIWMIVALLFVSKLTYPKMRQSIQSCDCFDIVWHDLQVPFTEALDLVRGRRVYLHHGFAYVPQDDLVSILLTVYRIQLSHSLAVSYFLTRQREWLNSPLEISCVRCPFSSQSTEFITRTA